MIGNYDDAESLDPTLSLTGMKRARKQIEQDAQQLANRIALLKQEELKAWKKIEETKKKAQNAYTLKKKNEEKQEMKKRTNETMQNFRSTEMRRYQQEEREQIREAIQNHKKQELEEIRRLKEQNERKREEVKRKQLEEKLKKHNMIKEQEERSNAKKKEFLEKKKKMIKEQLEQKRQDEQSLKIQREMEVLDMEKLELELIRKLHLTQQVQKSVYDELEIAISEKPEEYERKFLPNKTPKSFLGQQKDMIGSNYKQKRLVEVRSADNLTQTVKTSEGASYQIKKGFKGQPRREVKELDNVRGSAPKLKLKISSIQDKTKDSTGLEQETYSPIKHINHLDRDDDSQDRNIDLDHKDARGA